MLITHEREKLINAIVFFASRTRHCGKVKLFKLLYFLDFAHFQQIGRSVTGLDYYAWKMGPVPVDLYEEIDMPEPDLGAAVEFTRLAIKNGEMLRPDPKKEFDPSHFSKREMTLMDSLADEYRESLADDMIEATHLENLPWHEVYVVQNKRQSKIPYEFALRKGDKEEVEAVARAGVEVKENYR